MDAKTVKMDGTSLGLVAVIQEFGMAVNIFVLGCESYEGIWSFTFRS